MNIFDRLCPDGPTPATPPDYPRFCHRCGSALVPMCKPDGYDERTGAPLFERWLKCPKYEGETRYKTVQYSFSGSDVAARLDPTYTVSTEPSYYGRAKYMDCKPDDVPAPAPKARSKR